MSTRRKTTQVQKCYDQICRLGLLEDRREYDVEDLKLSLTLTDTEAQQLFNLIQANFKVPQ